MAIFKTRDVNAHFTFSRLNEDVAYYWGISQNTATNEVLPNEVTFPIHIQQLKVLMNASQTHTVALRVENFKNKATVTASWISYNNGNQTSDTVTEDNLFYAVLDELTINKITQIGRNPAENFPYICARLGVHNKLGSSPELIGDNFFVYFNRAKVSVHRGGIGGEPEGSGAVVR